MGSDRAFSPDDARNVVIGLRELRPFAAPDRGDARAVPGQRVILESDGLRRTVDPAVIRSVLTVLEAVIAREQADAATDEAELSPQEAADILGMSRPTVMRLIERGRLRARKVNTHHRLLRAEVAAYRESQAVTRRQALRSLSEMSVEHDF